MHGFQKNLFSVHILNFEWKNVKFQKNCNLEGLQDIPHIHELIIIHADCLHNIEEKR